MKKTFTKPELSIAAFEVEDIMTTSDPEPTIEGTEQGENVVDASTTRPGQGIL